VGGGWVNRRHPVRQKPRQRRDRALCERTCSRIPFTFAETQSATRHLPWEYSRTLAESERSVTDILVRIKRAVLAGRYVFSEKARIEMEADRLTELDVAESILNAVAIYKTVRSRSPFRTQPTEYLHVIQSTNLDGLMIYTKGKLVREAETETYYFLISSKRAI
jgi:hypothetical protein